jgi:hypothetical protein
MMEMLFLLFNENKLNLFFLNFFQNLNGVFLLLNENIKIFIYNIIIFYFN